MNNSTYLDSGFDQFFQRQIVSGGPGQDVSQFDFESQFLGLSGDQMQGGTIQSKTGRLQINLDEDYFFVSDGTQERVRQGKLDDGSYGLLIKDKSGNILMQIGDTNYIKSGNQMLELNFDEVQLLFRNESGVTQGVIGNI